MSEEDQGNAAPDGRGDQPAGAKSAGKGPLILALLVGAAIIILGAAVYYMLVLRDTRPHVWAEPTVPYEAESCAEEGACETIDLAAAGHGAHGEESGTLFVYNPNIDDEIAQWGDCIDQIFVCIQTGMEAEGADGAETVRGCVAAADQCPGECREHFAGRAGGLDIEAMEALFFETFVDERGYCVPREADQ